MWYNEVQYIRTGLLIIKLFLQRIQLPLFTPKLILAEPLSGLERVAQQQETTVTLRNRFQRQPIITQYSTDDEARLSNDFRNSQQRYSYSEIKTPQAAEGF